MRHHITFGAAQSVGHVIRGCEEMSQTVLCDGMQLQSRLRETELPSRGGLREYSRMTPTTPSFLGCGLLDLMLSPEPATRRSARKSQLCATLSSYRFANRSGMYILDVMFKHMCKPKLLVSLTGATSVSWLRRHANSTYKDRIPGQFLTKLNIHPGPSHSTWTVSRRTVQLKIQTFESPG